MYKIIFRNSCMLLLILLMGLAVPAQIRITVSSEAHPEGSDISLRKQWPALEKGEVKKLENGKQEFELSGNGEQVVELSLRNPFKSLTILVQQEDVQVRIGKDGKTTIKGSPYQDTLDDYLLRSEPVRRAWNKVGEEYIAEKDMEKKIVLSKKSEEYARQVAKMDIEFIKQNASNLAGAWYAYQMAFAWQRDALGQLIPLFENKSGARATLEKLMTRWTEESRHIMVNEPAPAIVLKSPDGKTISLNELVKKNKYVMVDFWASWCTPCRVTNRKLAPHYNELKKKGIEFLSVSVDEDPAAWKQAVDADKIPWPQVVFTEGMKGGLVGQYKVRSLPATFLIDYQGVIVAQDIHLEDLQKLQVN